MSFKPTPQQEEIVKASVENRMLKVNAAAGTGKTATLSLIANANLTPSLYIAFNKSMAMEAASKFPSHVVCKTIHSIAFGRFGRDLMHKLNRPKGKYVNVAGTSAEVARFYKIEDIMDEYGHPAVTKSAQGLLVRQTVARYEASDAERLTSKFVPNGAVRELCKDGDEKVDQAMVAMIVEKITGIAQQLWEDRQDLHSQVLATHDTYLKLYQLSKPTLNFEVIYLDEAQDVSDVMLDIIMRQDAKIILVGDSRQAIYGWRGAVNAMGKVECATKYLTQSFRYGQAVANVGTAIIGGEMKIQGFDKVDSQIGVVDTNKPYTILFRTNSALLATAVELLREGNKVSAEVDSRDFIKFLESAQALFEDNLKGVKHDSVVPYSDWNGLLDATNDEPELKRVAKIIMDAQTELFITSLKSLEKKQENAHVTLTTGHKSKGREFSQVILASDFPDADSKRMTTEELNLLYVGATRAIDVLQINETVATLVDTYERDCRESGEKPYFF